MISAHGKANFFFLRGGGRGGGGGGEYLMELFMRMQPFLFSYSYFAKNFAIMQPGLRFYLTRNIIKNKTKNKGTTKALATLIDGLVSKQIKEKVFY